MPVVNGKRYPYTQKGLEQATRAYSRLEAKRKKQEPAPTPKKDDASEIKKKFPRRKYIA